MGISLHRIFFIFLVSLVQGYDGDDDMEVLKEIIARDPLSEVSEQEKEQLWRMR